MSQEIHKTDKGYFVDVYYNVGMRYLANIPHGMQILPEVFPTRHRVPLPNRSQRKTMGKEIVSPVARQRLERLKRGK